MTKRVITLFVAVVMLLGLLAACSKDSTMSVEDAKKLVLQDLGIKQSQADSIDSHLTTIDSAACYLIYVSYNGEHWQYTVNSLTGEILDKTENDTGHSH